jgi:hypothetical protein
MDTAKPTKTLADYLVIAISPVLIMVLVHSLCFFLVAVFYRGEAAGGVRWVLFWFVLAVVLIARIGIEQGDTNAMIYGLFLALATWVYLATVQPNVMFGAILLGIVWFTAHKITCNCTLIDDEADASGQGLLQSLRRLPPLFKKKQTSAATTAPIAEAATTSDRAKKNAASQTPGVWLVYYSLAALPIFGLGQTLLPANDVAARHQSFVYLFLYLCAALGLLVTTSFLGLRRYLRQRYLAMPANIAFGWVQFGVIAAVVVLCLALLLPRPGAGEAWGTLRYHVDYQLRRASEYAARFNPHGTGSGRSGTRAPASGQSENKSSQAGQAADSNSDTNTRAEGQGEPQSGNGPKQGTGQDGNGNPGKSAPDLSPSASSIYPWLKVLFWLAAATVLSWLIVRYRVAILAALRSAWTAIRDFIAALLGLFRGTAPPPSVTSRKTAVQPFKLFKNPFLTGGDRVWPPEQLITYSYDALRSWVMETEAKQGSPQTPREFCRQLGAEMPDAANALEHLSFLYGHVAYGASVPGNYDREQLRLLWDYMAVPKPVPSGSG